MAVSRQVARQVPNTLTAARLVMSAAFPLVPESWRVWVVVAAAVSDAADGLLARRLGATGSFGAMLDVVADKCFTLVVLLTLVVEGRVGSWWLPLLMARDLAVAWVAVCVVRRRAWGAMRRLPPRPLGKLTTAGVLATLVAATAQWWSVAMVMVWIAGALSASAAVDYLLAYERGRRPASEGLSGAASG